MIVAIASQEDTTAVTVTEISPKEGVEIFQQLTAPKLNVSDNTANLSSERAKQIVREMAPQLTSRLGAVRLYRYLIPAGLKEAVEAVESLGVQKWGQW